MLEIKNVVKTYNKSKRANDGITLSIEQGDLFGFVGHNGAGKTTLLKAIAGIIDFDSGEILVDGYSIKKDPLLVKQRIAYIPDNPDIYESLSGIEYLNFIGDVFKVPTLERKSLIEAYAKKFELDQLLIHPISSYSHGMKQKLVIISALIHKPKLLLLDEPFVGLDPKAAFLLKEEFKALCEAGSSIFFSTHVLEVVEKLCNKVAIIKQGKIVAGGYTQDIIKDQSLEHLFMEIASEA
jgi:ABC-2 type transport system ATP-binding protein